MKNILVTGSSGYIGQHLCKLLSSHYRVYGYDTKYNMQNVDTLFEQSILNLAPAAKEFEFDTVIHLAALVRVNESVQNPIAYYETNLTGTINMLKNIKYKNFVFASTGAATNPISPYALSKRCAEDVVERYCIENGKTFTTFRFYNVTGTDGIPPTNPDGLFYRLQEASRTGTFEIYGKYYNTKDGTCVREYIHVNDICRSLIKAIETPSNDIQNLAYGDTRTVEEIVNIFKEVNGIDFQVIYKEARPGDLESCYLDNPSRYVERNYTYEQMLKWKP